MEQPEKKAGIWALFFDNRYLLFLTIAVTLVAGFSAIQNLPRLEDPVITNRNPLVLTVFPGASAERIEALVSKKIEIELQEVDAIKTIETTSRAGASVVNIELAEEITKKTADAIHSEIRDKISDAAGSFPAEVMTPDYDDKRNAVAFTIIIGLRWSDSNKQSESLGILSRRAEDLADRLRQIPGTELVRLFGQPTEEVRVEIDPESLAERGLTSRSIAEAIRRADVKVPAGQLRGNTADLLVEVEGKIESLDRVRDVIIQQDSGGAKTVRVGDVARVSKAWQEPPSEIAYTNQQRAVFVAARINEEQRVDSWDKKAEHICNEFRKEIGSSIQADIVFRQNEYTEERLGSLVGNLVLGSLVVMVVIFLTMGWRRSLIVSSALPLTAAATLFAISMQGGKLHQMSIFGMIIALGLLIDTAIVITDEVRKFLEKGCSRREAVIGALKHLFVPLLSSTLTSMLAFMPILLLPGSAGDFVGSIGGSVITAVGLSFILSLTVIAALAGLYSSSVANAKKPRKLPRFFSEGVSLPWFTAFMRGLIRLSVRYPFLGIFFGAIIPICGFVLAQTLGSQFFPRTDRDMFTIEITLPSVAAIDETINVAQEAEKVIRSKAGIERVHWLAGGSFPPVYYNLIQSRDNSSEYATAVIKADNFRTVDRLVPELQKELERQIPEAVIQVSKFAQGPPANADVEIRVLGPSLAQLQELGDQIHRRIAEHPDVLYAITTQTRGEPKLMFETDEKKARAASIDPANIADQLQTHLEGLNGGSLLEGVEELPVRVRVPNEIRGEISQLENLRLVGSDGSRVPLRAVGKFEMRPESGAITRRNGQRMNSIRGYTRSGALPIEITKQVMADLNKSDFTLPPGYSLELGGEAENQGDAVGNLLLYLPVLVTLIIAILILSFRSVRIALILCVAAFLSVGYGLLATWIMQFPLSFNSILGSIGLIGLAFNDSIVSIAAIHANPKAKSGDIDEITQEVLGCGRHLISTTLTTIGSFLPLLILIGGQFWPPLAIVLVGGVGGATFLAAVFTPAAYRMIAARKYRNVEER